MFYCNFFVIKFTSKPLVLYVCDVAFRNFNNLVLSSLNLYMMFSFLIK